MAAGEVKDVCDTAAADLIRCAYAVISDEITAVISDEITAVSMEKEEDKNETQRNTASSGKSKAKSRL